MVVGTADVFETMINKRSEEGYIICGNMNTNITEDKKMLFSQLMNKYEVYDSVPTDESPE